MSLRKSQHAVDSGLMDLPVGKVVKGLVRHLDQMARDERSALGCSLGGGFQETLPFHHRPAPVAVLSEPGEDGREIHLTIAKAAEAPRPLGPRRVAGIDTLPTIGAEFGILDMKGRDTVVIEIN